MEARRKKSSRAPKAFNLNGYIFGALRRLWGWYPPRREALSRAKVSGQDRFRCTTCGSSYPRKLVHVDHHNPVVPLTGFADWNTHIERLFCEVGNLAVLCKPCHKVKSSGEATIRAKHRKANKEKKNVG